MRVTVIGTGYVGLVTGACLAATGNHVTCVDKDERKIQVLLDGGIPIHEPGLERVVRQGVEGGRLSFTTDFEAGVHSGKIIFIAVGTPPGEDGSADLSMVEGVAAQIGDCMNDYKVIVDKSTVPVGTGAKVKAIVEGRTSHPFAVISNPEFLKEGAAVKDFMGPDRVVIGGDDPQAIELMRALYAPYMRRGDRFLVMDIESAEMTKYASNAMLATRISFMNEVAALCEKVGANVENVRRGMAADVRIGSHFLFPGAGFGGSCFPKDLRALKYTGSLNDVPMQVIEAVEDVNRAQKHVLANKIKARFGADLSGKTFALWGLAFKPGTDDMREAPAITIANDLLAAGAKVRAADPVAHEEARGIFGDRIEISQDAYGILDGADALLLVTEWNQWRSPDFDRIRDALRGDTVIDGRNIWSRAFVESHGLHYDGIGT